MSRKILSLTLSISLLFQYSGFAQSINLADYLSQGHNVIALDRFRPLALRYFSYQPSADNFKILLDKGDQKNLSDTKIKDEAEKLLTYFKIGLSLPNEKFWVNLRPDAQDQIIDPELEKTDLGKVLLEADLQLKKDTSSLTSPQSKEGKVYWDKLYKKAGELFGTENITIPTITRPWIVPGEIIVRESKDSDYIYKAVLKVMLEEDYLRGMKGEGRGMTASYSFKDPRLNELNKYSTELIRETILPELTKRINSSKDYANLRQVFFSLILARWFKDSFSNSGSVSAPENSYIKLIDSGDLTNLTSKEAWSKTAYFNEYKKSFKDGEYNLSEKVYTPTGQSIRRYTSGGMLDLMNGKRHSYNHGIANSSIAAHRNMVEMKIAGNLKVGSPLVEDEKLAEGLSGGLNNEGVNLFGLIEEAFEGKGSELDRAGHQRVVKFRTDINIAGVACKTLEVSRFQQTVKGNGVKYRTIEFFADESSNEYVLQIKVYNDGRIEALYRGTISDDERLIIAAVIRKIFKAESLIILEDLFQKAGLNYNLVEQAIQNRQGTKGVLSVLGANNGYVDFDPASSIKIGKINLNTVSVMKLSDAVAINIYDRDIDIVDGSWISSHIYLNKEISAILSGGLIAISDMENANEIQIDIVDMVLKALKQEHSEDYSKFRGRFLAALNATKSSSAVEALDVEKPIKPYKKIVYIVLDGVSDGPNGVVEFGGKTPLEQAKLPYLNSLVEQGVMGRMHTVGEGIAPQSDEAVLSILSYGKDNYPGRGIIEALGADVDVPEGGVAFRVNFSTGQKEVSLNIKDRRAGRNLSTEEAQKLAAEINEKVKLTAYPGAQFKFTPTIEHRGILVIHVPGKTLSPYITNGDPGYGRKGLSSIALEEGKFDYNVKEIKPQAGYENNEGAKILSDLTNEFVEKSYEVLDKSEINNQRRSRGHLPGNLILVRDATERSGEFKSLLNKTGMNWAMFAEVPAEFGIGKLTGMEVIRIPKTGKDPQKEYGNIAAQVIEAMQKYDGLYVHIKGPDLPAHDGKAQEKVNVIQDIDEYFLGPLIKSGILKGSVVAVTADHSTSVVKKSHTDDPVPLLIVDGVDPDATKTFTEQSAEKGSLGIIKGTELLAKLVKIGGGHVSSAIENNGINTNFKLLAKIPKYDNQVAEGLKGKNVLVRINTNVKSKNGEIDDPARLEKIVPVVKSLLDNGATPILIGHNGRLDKNKGKDDRQSLKYAAKYINDNFFKDRVVFHEASIAKDSSEGLKINKSDIKKGKVNILENVRFADEYELGGGKEKRKEFAESLMSLSDGVFIFDAFGDIGSEGVSVEDVPLLAKEVYAGPAMLEEFAILEKKIVKGFSALIFGGAKLDKIPLLKGLVEALPPEGFALIGSGPSPALRENAELFKKLESGKAKVITALDYKLDGENRYDIGEETAKEFLSKLDTLKSGDTVVYNGTMGYVEHPSGKFQGGTEAIVNKLKELTERGVLIIVIGGDAGAAAKKYGLTEKENVITFTGGRVPLNILAEETLVGLEALVKKVESVSSALQTIEKDDVVGGIDLRQMNMLIQPQGGFASSSLDFSLPELNKAEIEAFDLDKELELIQRMASSGIDPIDERLKRYLAVCFARGKTGKEIDDLKLCLEDVFIAQQLDARQTPDGYKEVIVIADTRRYVLKESRLAAGYGERINLN